MQCERRARAGDAPARSPHAITLLPVASSPFGDGGGRKSTRPGFLPVNDRTNVPRGCDRAHRSDRGLQPRCARAFADHSHRVLRAKAGCDHVLGPRLRLHRRRWVRNRHGSCLLAKVRHDSSEAHLLASRYCLRSDADHLDFPRPPGSPGSAHARPIFTRDDDSRPRPCRTISSEARHQGPIDVARG